MKTYKLIFENGKEKIVFGKNILEIVKKYELANRFNIKTKVIELS